MNVDGACDGGSDTDTDSDDDDEDGASVKEEPVEEGDFDLGIVPADAELDDEDDYSCFETSSGSAVDDGGEGGEDITPAPASVRRDPMQSLTCGDCGDGVRFTTVESAVFHAVFVHGHRFCALCSSTFRTAR